MSYLVQSSPTTYTATLQLSVMTNLPTFVCDATPQVPRRALHPSAEIRKKFECCDEVNVRCENEWRRRKRRLSRDLQGCPWQLPMQQRERTRPIAPSFQAEETTETTLAWFFVGATESRILPSKMSTVSHFELVHQQESENEDHLRRCLSFLVRSRRDF